MISMKYMKTRNDDNKTASDINQKLEESEKSLSVLEILFTQMRHDIRDEVGELEHGRYRCCRCSEWK